MPTTYEWAFAGLTFDLTGALYSHLSVGDPASAWMPAAIGLLLIAASYVAYRTMRKASIVGSDRDRRAFSRPTTS